MNERFERKKIKKSLRAFQKGTLAGEKLDIWLFHSDLPADQNQINILNQ
jgi:hypothetical protein